MDNIPTAIDLVSTEDLIDILLSRCTDAVFIGLKPEQYAPDNYWYEIKGTRITCNGLVQELRDYMEDWRKRIVSES